MATKAYAEVGIQKENMDKYMWVADHIDTLSPMICQLVLSDIRLIFVNPQS